MPKELMPIVDKPLIQYAAEEAIAAGRMGETQNAGDHGVAISLGEDQRTGRMLGVNHARFLK